MTYVARTNNYRRAIKATHILCWFILLLSTTLRAQTFQLSGSVTHGAGGNASPVSEADLSVTDDNGSKSVSARTTTSGRFSVSVSPDWSVIRFAMPGWIIDDPVVGARGRTYVPRGVGPASFSIKVCHHSEISCFSVKAVLEQKLYLFQSTDQHAAGTWMGPRKATFFRSNRPSPDFRLVRVKDLPTVTDDFTPSSGDWTDFLSQEADLLGVSVETLQSKINDWGKEATTVSDLALFSAYREDYTSAATQFAAAINKEGIGAQGQNLIGAAYSNFKLGNFKDAELYLSKAIARFPDDAILDANMRVLRDREDEKSSQALGSEAPAAPGASIATNPLENCAKQPPEPFVTSCNPFGNNATHTDADSECPVGGDSKPNTAEHAQDLVKNEFCAKPPGKDITIVQLAQLQDITVHTLGIPEGSPPANRHLLSSSTKLPFHEGDFVRLKAFALKAETADIGSDESGESVNCNIGPKNGCSNTDSIRRNDIHIALVATLNQSECSSVTAEITPHLRPTAWNEAAIQGLKGKLVRISGQLMFDGSHSVCINGKAKRGSPPRQSSWEIHPVYGIEVCQNVVKNECAEVDWKPFQ